MKSLIVSLMLLAYPQLSFAAVDAWRMNQFTGKPDYYQTGVDSTTVEAIAVSTSALAVQTAALSVSTAANAARITSLEVSTATLDSTLSAEIQVRQELATQVAIDTTAIGGVSLSAYNEFTSSNSFSSILIASGTHGLGDDLMADGAGSRFFFYPKKSAIRGGSVTADQWNDANIGNWSIALGYNSIASAQYAIAMGPENTATYSGAVSVGGGGNDATGQNSAAYGGSENSVSGQNSGALAGNQVNVTGNQAGAFAGGPSTVSGDFSASVGGTNTTVSGKASVAGGEWAQAASDYSFVYGRYVGLADAADGSMLFGYDTSSVKTYSESGKFYIHGLDLRVSSSTTAAVQYGLTKEGVARVHSITATDNVVASTVTVTSTATLAALSVSGTASLTGPTAISSATITGYVDVGIVEVSSTCVIPTNVSTQCTATCATGFYAITGGYTGSNAYAPYLSRRVSSGTAWATSYYCSSQNATAYAYCARIK